MGYYATINSDSLQKNWPPKTIQDKLFIGKSKIYNITYIYMYTVSHAFKNHILKKMEGLCKQQGKIWFLYRNACICTKI